MKMKSFFLLYFFIVMLYYSITLNSLLQIALNFPLPGQQLSNMSNGLVMMNIQNMGSLQRCEDLLHTCFSRVPLYSRAEMSSIHGAILTHALNLNLSHCHDTEYVISTGVTQVLRTFAIYACTGNR